MTAKRLACVVNPHGGRRRAMAAWEQVGPVLEGAQYQLDVRTTERPGHARQIARTLTPDRYGGCCVVGGDGTIHEVVNGLMDGGQPASIPLGLVAAGTGNDVVR